MKPCETGKKYGKISAMYQSELAESQYGVEQVKRALAYSKGEGMALDVGCGAGGRIITLLENAGFQIKGVDVSASMIEIASRQHSNIDFEHADICQWQTNQSFDLIVAWDSLFHLPFEQHGPVINKLCDMLSPQGVVIYTFGNDEGEHFSRWHDDDFYYSSIGINQNLQLLMDKDLKILHLELDQYPLKHAYTIAQKQA